MFHQLSTRIASRTLLSGSTLVVASTAITASRCVVASSVLSIPSRLCSTASVSAIAEEGSATVAEVMKKTSEVPPPPSFFAQDEPISSVQTNEFSSTAPEALDADETEDVVAEDVFGALDETDPLNAMDAEGDYMDEAGTANATPILDTDNEKPIEGSIEELGFKTETQQLLNIVACSLYTDKEVFIRELVSNASDALEKRRHLELADAEKYGREVEDAPPRISISCNQSKMRFVIEDTGIGMTKEELTNNLGTIAGSGSKAFVRQLQEAAGQNGGLESVAQEKIIGQFGVGFYSTFMVARNVKVFTRSCEKGAKGYLWESDGTGTFTITECEGVHKGTKIVLEVKDTEISFCSSQVVERVLKKYSNFVSFPIMLNNDRVNTVEALWTKSKDEISKEEDVQFYRFISNAYDSPMFRLHYAVDAPLSIRALLYIPGSHMEKFGGVRMESGVNLYSRRVLIQSKCKGLMPEWLRFVKGAVDSESIPLNISREQTQDSAMMRRLNSILTKRIIRWLEEEARRDKPSYEAFFKEFGSFLKEGICTDPIHKSEIAKLLRFETTSEEADQALTSFDEYRDRMKPQQSHIYYIAAPSKQLALISPYYEQYKDHGLEVLVLTESIDDFVMQHLDTYSKHKLQSIELFDANLDGSVIEKKKQDVADGKSDADDAHIDKKLNEMQCKALSDFFQKRLMGKVGVVKPTERLRDSPAVIADHESAQMRKLYKFSGLMNDMMPKYNLTFNPKHELIRKMYVLSQSSDSTDVETAGLLAEQIFDNATIAAGLLDDPRTIVNRLNMIMMKMVKNVNEPQADQ